MHTATAGQAPQLATAAGAVTQVPPQELLALASDFWKWRAATQPFTADDIPRLDRPATKRDWSAAGIAKQHAALAQFDQRYKGIDASHWPVPAQVDYRLIGSALGRVHWELDVNPRWQRDPTFYVDQTLGAVTEGLLRPENEYSADIFQAYDRLKEIPEILSQAKAYLHPLRPFAELAIASLTDIRAKLEKAEPALEVLFSSPPNSIGAHNALVERTKVVTEAGIVALEDYRAWLQAGLASMPTGTSIGRDKYEFFLTHVALIPYVPARIPGHCL